MGNALIGRLRHSLLDRKVPLWLETPVTELVREDGRVSGVVATREGKPCRIRALKGVIIGAGGFEHSQQMRERYLPGPTLTAWSAARSMTRTVGTAPA